MISFPAVVVHGLDDARTCLAPGAGVILLSGEGAALYAGAGWWRALVEAAHREHPDTPCADILDCADAPGQAMAALRAGCLVIVLEPGPAFAAVASAAAGLGATVLPARPVALDLGKPGAKRRLPAWLQGDRTQPLG